MKERFLQLLESKLKQQPMYYGIIGLQFVKETLEGFELVNNLEDATEFYISGDVKKIAPGCIEIMINRKVDASVEY